MKTCNSCGTLFEPYSKKGAKCRPCKQQYDREYHLSRSSESKATKIALNKKRQEKLKAAIHTIKKQNGCTFCAEDEPICLDFHHLDPTEKDINVSDALKRGWTVERMQKEIDKCITVCSNCHRKVHAGLIRV